MANPDPTSLNMERIVKNLEAIKKLLILDLSMKGITSEGIGQILGVDSSVVRRMVPTQRIKAKSKKVGGEIINNARTEQDK